MKIILTLLLTSVSLWAQRPITGIDISWPRYGLQPILISNVVWNLTNYPVLVDLIAPNFNFSTVKPNGSDIRFFDTDRSTRLQHWIEEWDPIFRRGSRCWVLVPLMTSNVVKTIYVGRGYSSDLSSCSNTFQMLGKDFADGTTAGITINTSGSTLGIDTPTRWFSNNMRIDNWTRDIRNPLFTSNSPSAWDGKAVRDMFFMCDPAGHLTRDGDLIKAYYMGRPTNDNPTKIGLAISSDGGVSFSRHSGNPVLSPSANTNDWDSYYLTAGSAFKLGSGSYIMYYSASGYPNTNRTCFGYATSTDGTNWVKATGNPIITPEGFTALGTNGQISVPYVIKLSSGNWFMTWEALVTPANNFRIYAAISSDGTNWNTFNNKNAIVDLGAGWNSGEVANPKVLEPTLTNYFMIMNGSTFAGGYQLGVYKSTDLTNWTAFANNPVLLLTQPTNWQSSAIETGSPFQDQVTFLREDFKDYYQGFVSYHTASSIGLGYMYQNTLLDCNDGSNTANSWTVGTTVGSSTNFEARITIQDDQRAANNASVLQALMLCDSATVPAGQAAATFNPKRRVGIYRQNWSQGTAVPNKFFFTYMDTGGTLQFWTGSAWATSGQAHYGDAGVAVCYIQYNGTNYTMGLLAKDGTSVASATIAASSVKSFSSGKAIYCGDVYSDADYEGQKIRNFYVRPFVKDPTTYVVP